MSEFVGKGKIFGYFFKFCRWRILCKFQNCALHIDYTIGLSYRLLSHTISKISFCHAQAFRLISGNFSCVRVSIHVLDSLVAVFQYRFTMYSSITRRPVNINKFRWCIEVHSIKTSNNRQNVSTLFLSLRHGIPRIVRSGNNHSALTIASTYIVIALKYSSYFKSYMLVVRKDSIREFYTFVHKLL